MFGIGWSVVQTANGTQHANGNLAKHIEALSNEDPAVRSDAADALGMLGESAADAGYKVKRGITRRL